MCIGLKLLCLKPFIRKHLLQSAGRRELCVIPPLSTFPRSLHFPPGNVASPPVSNRAGYPDGGLLVVSFTSHIQTHLARAKPILLPSADATRHVTSRPDNECERERELERPWISVGSYPCPCVLVVPILASSWTVGTGQRGSVIPGYVHLR